MKPTPAQTKLLESTVAPNAVDRHVYGWKLQTARALVRHGWALPVGTYRYQTRPIAEIIANPSAPQYVANEIDLEAEAQALNKDSLLKMTIEGLRAIGRENQP